MLFRIAALIAAVGFILSAAPRVGIADVPPPVVVKSCDIDHYRLSLDVTFTNASTKTVKDVQFALTSADGVLALKDDAGTYAAGEVVSHRLRVPLGPYFGNWGKVGCAAARVTFDDGTTWDSLTVSPDLAKNFKQTPGSNLEFSRCFVADQVYMDFENKAPQDITSIDLGVVQRGLLVWTIPEVGPFTQGTVMHKSWTGDSSRRIQGMAIASDMLQTQCTVTSITYADGTTWKNPSPPPASFKGIPLDPPSPAPDAPLAVGGCTEAR